MSVEVFSYVWKHSQQKGTALLMLLAIADSANPDGDAWAGLHHFAEKARVDERTARRLIRKLEGTGELVVYRNKGKKTRNGRTNYYHVPMKTMATPKQAPEIPARPDELTGGKNAPPSQEGVKTPPQEGVKTPPQEGVKTPPDPFIDPSIDPKDKDSSTVVDGLQNGSGDSWQAILEASRITLGFGTSSYKLAARYAQFLSGRVPEKDKRGRKNGDWFDLQIDPGMVPLEIDAWRLWLNDTYEGEPLRKPETINDYVGRFRDDPQHAQYLTLARVYADDEPPVEEPAPSIDTQDYSAEIQATLAGLRAAKRGVS